MSVSFVREGRILVAMLDRPDKRNAINRDMLDALADALRDAESDPGVVALAVTGAGQHFCAGADIAGYHGTELADLRSFTETAKGLCQSMEDATIPVLAVVKGMVLGGGMELCLAADVVLAHPSATFGLPELRLGLIPGWGGTQRLPRVAGRQVASDVIFSSGRLDAEAAARAGVVSRVLSAERFDDDVADYFSSLSVQSRPALRAAKRAIRGAGASDGHVVETEELMARFAGRDGVEGVAAFVERRDPIFMEQPA